MIYELNPSQFKSISHLLSGDRINLEIKAVVEGYNPGWVFVDNVMEPRTAMVWSKGIEGFYFLGDENSQDFNSSLKTYIKYIVAPRARKLNLTSFEFSGTSERWEERLEQIFKDQNPKITKQFVYKRPSDLDVSTHRAKLESVYELRKIDKDLLNSDSVETSLVTENISTWWGNMTQFSKHGTGYCVVHEGEAVCSCMTSFSDGQEVESHIVTKDAYRKKGLAAAAVSSFIEEARGKSLNLYWDCMEKNEGSRALAEKLGYEKAYEYKLYEFPI